MTMSKASFECILTAEAADQLRLSASEAFSPRTPISSRELFAGRWPQIQALVDTVAQPGLHGIVFGERGVGKTSLANILSPLLAMMDLGKATPRVNSRIVVQVNANSADTFSSVWRRALDEISWEEDRPTLGFGPKTERARISLRQAFSLSDELTIDDVRRTLPLLDRSVFIIDEFDRLARKHTAAFTDLIKALSDAGSPTTVVLVGVAETVELLVKDHASIQRAVVQIRMPRMTEAELKEILRKAEATLHVRFDPEASTRITRMSQGFPHFTHLVGLNSVRAAAERHSRCVGRDDVANAFEQAVKQADQTLASAYAEATHSAQPGALYEHVLLASAIAACSAAGELGYFQASNLVEPMEVILKRNDVEISTFNRHLSDFLEEKRGKILERTGSQRGYRYRFAQPLMPPFVLMRGVTTGFIEAQQVEVFVSKALAES